MGLVTRRVLPVYMSSVTASAVPDSSQLRAVVVKVTRRCNIRCRYCYEHLGREGDMSIDTFQLAAEWALTGTNSPSVTIIFHGGEPTLVGEFWFARAITLARTVAAREGKTVNFAIQSNGVDVSDSMLQLFRREGVRLSLSVDGPTTIPTMRPGTESVVATVKRARMSGVNPGILMTINHDNWSYFDEIYEWLRDDVRVTAFKANVVSAVGLGANLTDLSAESIVFAQMTILESMLKNIASALVVEENLGREILRFVYGENILDRHSLCHGKPCGAGTSVAGVSPDGRVLPCGRFDWDNEEFTLGSVRTTDFTANTVSSAGSERVKLFHELIPSNWTHCSECEARKICSFGCQAFIVRSRSQQNVECKPTRQRHQFYRDHLERLRPLAAIIAKKHHNWQVPADSSLPRTELHYNDHTHYYDYNDYSDTHH